MRADDFWSVWGAVFIGKCVLVRCSIREEGMSWKGVQGGNPEGEERMRGSALSSPMGVPLGYFHGYKKNEKDKRKRNVRAMLSYLPLPYGFPLSNPFPLPIPL